jgi:bifunctional non-homologous end joining protein LigD
MTLTKYIGKRNFKKTPEPKGKVLRPSKNLTFVVQRHDASHLHYDFRLELDGVLKSWAIPKGPSLNPGDKRLAVRGGSSPLTESLRALSPREITAREPWISGTKVLIHRNPMRMVTLRLRCERALGPALKITLHGKKLKGSVRPGPFERRKGKNWLLIKHRDEFATNGMESSTKKLKHLLLRFAPPRPKKKVQGLYSAPCLLR